MTFINIDYNFEIRMILKLKKKDKITPMNFSEPEPKQYSLLL